MKKILAMLLVAVLALGMAACGAINKTPVAVLWAEGDTAVIPNSLINAMDRAMYIENIAYRYYGAEGDQAKQTAQAEEALNAGAAVLMVELVDNAAAQSIVDLAKSKGAHVVFFACEVDDSVVAGYDKCYNVKTDDTTLVSTYFDHFCEYVLSNTAEKEPKSDDMDLDDDGKISYVTVGEIEFAQDKAIRKGDDGEPLLKNDGSYERFVELVKLDASFADLQLDEETVEASGLFGSATTYRKLKTADGKVVEMVLVADDVQAKDVLIALQNMGMNTNELATSFVPVFTVGNEVDYKALVLEGAPTEEEALKAHYEAHKYLCDLTTVEEEDLEEMIYTTVNVIDSGRITGTVIENYDAIAEAVAALAASIVKGEAAAEQVMKIPYPTYGG